MQCEAYLLYKEAAPYGRDFMWIHEHVRMSMYLTQLFSAPHLSEALLSRECVRIGWPATAAKGRLGAPYFSREKSEGCSVRPPPTHSLTLYKAQGTCPPRASSEGPSSQARSAKGIRQLLFECGAPGWAAERVGCRGKFVWDNRRRGGQVRMASHLL